MDHIASSASSANQQMGIAALWEPLPLKRAYIEVGPSQDSFIVAIFF